MVTREEIIELNKKVQIPLLLTFLGANPHTIKQIGSKADYRCPAWFRGGDNPHGFAVTYDFYKEKWLCTDFTGKTFSNLDLIDFGIKYAGKTFREMIHYMVFFSGADDGFDGVTIPDKLEQPRILTDPIPLDPSIGETIQFGLHPYWSKQGFTPEIAKNFMLGFSNYGEMKDRLTIPVFDTHGTLIAIQGRSIDDRLEPKYRFISGTGESAKIVLYNLHRAKFKMLKRGWLGVVEGAKSVWRAEQYGYENFVSTLATSVTDKQVELLKKCNVNIVIFYDYDATETMSGQIGAVSLANKLVKAGIRKDIYIVNIGFHASPDELTLEQWTMSLKNAIKFTGGQS